MTSHRIAIIYGTTEGQTRKIAEHMAQTLRHHDDRVELLLGSELDPDFEPTAYDGIIIGASIHEGRHQRYIRGLAKKHAPVLSEMPSAFFSVSMSAAADDTLAEAAQALEAFQEESGWKPAQAEAVAGALKYTEYSWLKRFIMKKSSASKGGETDTEHDWEYTDWDQVTRFAETFHERLD
ncbi:MAG: protoporphyrinogen oxidase [Deltaproteobacteria bacterium]|nr:protoporphyrinogen oxidase [Deltaproteobacteria bacterium]